MKKYTHLFFDLDRTLWDFEANAEETFKELYSTYKLDRHYDSFNEFHSSYRRNNEYLWAEYRNNNITKDELRWRRFELTFREKNIYNEQLAQQIGEDYVKLSPLKTKLFPHTFELLNYLKPKYKLFLITNGFREVQYQKLDNTNLRPYFSKVFTSEEVGVNKPHIDYFNYVLERTGATSENALVIGDDLEVDIKGANFVNIDTVWFNTNGKKANRKITFEIHSLKELLDIL
jgi:putative hydrolase of the HAD superfamily